MNQSLKQATLSFLNLQEEFKENPLEQLQQYPNEKFDSKNILVIDHPNKFEKINLNELIVGVDVEQTKKLGYDGQVSLIQLKFTEQVVILDTIQLNDAPELKSFLKNLFENPNIRKVFYSGQQDLLWLQRDFNLQTQNYCDIKELAECIHKREETSLVWLWSNYCMHELSKSEKKQFQESDWQVRPLSDQQLQYAALDCFFLPYLHSKLLQCISQAQKWDQLEKAIQKMEKQRQKKYEPNRKLLDLNILKNQLKEFEKKNKKPLSYNQRSLTIYLMQQLYLISQEVAIKYNVPQIKLIDDVEILQISLNISAKYEQIIQTTQIQKNQATIDIYQQDKVNIYLGVNIISPKEELYSAINNFTTKIEQKILESDQFRTYIVSYIQVLEEQQQERREQDLRKREEKKQRFEQFSQKFTVKKPVYGEGKILSPNGAVLCVCDAQKVQWYLKHQLATSMPDNPLVIKLNFTPSALNDPDAADEEANQFYTETRENRCVVCGSSQNILKFNIIPVLYKRFFDDVYKSHRSHDIVILCCRCHEKAGASNDRMKEKIAEIYKIPLVTPNQQQVLVEKIRELKKMAYQYNNQTDSAQKKNEKFKKIKQNARSIYHEIISDPVIQEHQAVKQFHLNYNKNKHVKIDDKFVEFCVLLKEHQEEFRTVSKKQSKYSVHGKLVVNQLKNEKEMEDFIILWRKNFVETLDPQFLPPKWSINHKVKRQFGEKSVFYKQT